MSFIIVYLPTAEHVRLYTFYDNNYYDVFKGQKDVFDTYEEAINIVNDSRIINFLGVKYKDLAHAYIDHKNFMDDEDLVPKHLLEVIEVCYV
jgi:hypothetical protein